jgi:2-polyprenyl-3-methyl-5-hydroxy-6-metoxy-1,4-benzoquinol methylase
MNRDYQYDFSIQQAAAMYDRPGREKKAQTIVAVLKDYGVPNIETTRVLDIGASTGIIDNYLANYFGEVTGIDIDAKAINFASNTFCKPNLSFKENDAMDLDYHDEVFDIVVCAQIYEHVADATKLMEEIYRVLRLGGICYFAAGNRFQFMEPHYRLPLLSALPRSLAHLYIRLAGKADFYYEKHLSYWGLRKIVRNFELIDYTRKLVTHPERFNTNYMIPPRSLKQFMAITLLNTAFWLFPSYIWLLRKPLRVQ